MTDTAIASAQYIVPGAPSKEPAHNDALERLEQLAQITVVNRTTTSAPSSPAQGAAYIVASVPTGVWSAQTHRVAAYYSGWTFLDPREGWIAYDQGDNQHLTFDGSVWVIDRPMLAKDNAFSGTNTNSLQPAFLAYNSATDTNQTGNGASVTVDFDAEVFDQGADFAADTFTAPVTGKYRFSVRVTVNGITAAMTEAIVSLVTSNRTYRMMQIDPNNLSTASSVNVLVCGSVLADMDASDTAHVTVQISNGAGDTAGVYGDGANYLTMFSGELVA